MAKTKRVGNTSPASGRKRLATKARPRHASGETIPKPHTPPEKAFPIAGLGASAGGREALEEFFAHVPARSGMAFVALEEVRKKPGTGGKNSKRRTD